MKFFLFLLLTFIVNLSALHLSGVNKNGELDRYGKSKFLTIESKSLVGEIFSNKNSADGPFCKSIVAYYAGTLKNKKDPTKTHDVEFQVKLWADEKRKKLHVYADKWNEEYSKSEDFELDYYYGGNRQWCDIYDEDCTSSFTKKDTSFGLDLNFKDGNFFHLLNFSNFNNSFGLNKPKGQCSKLQLQGLDDDNTPDLNQLGFCVCCENYEPSPLLACPNDEWSGPAATTKQHKTTPSLKPHTQTCQAIFAAYKGTMQSDDEPSNKLNAHFQFRANASLKDQKIYFGLDKWKTKSKKFEIGIDYYQIGKIETCDAGRQPCSIDFYKEPLNFFLTEGSSGFDILDFLLFDKSFTLENVVGQCTNNHPFTDPSGVIPDTSLYSYCVCCGDYNPDPSLNCPLLLG